MRRRSEGLKQQSQPEQVAESKAVAEPQSGVQPTGGVAPIDEKPAAVASVAPAQQDPAESRPAAIDEKPGRQIPGVPADFASIVTATFDVPNPEQLYQQVERSLKPIKASQAKLGVLLDALDEAQESARMAQQLLANAKLTLGLYQSDLDRVKARMRDEASMALQAQKEAGKRAKAVTEADIEAQIAVMFPDEARTQQERYERAKRTLGYLESLCERTAERARDLRAIVSASRAAS